MAVIFRHIVVATDFSPCSEHAVVLATRMAQTLAAKLTLVHVWEVPVIAYAGLEVVTLEYLDAIEKAARELLDEELSRARRTVPEANADLRQGAGAEQIVAAAEQCGADLIVVGTHGRSGAKRLILGSVAERVVRTSPIAVLTVH